MAELDHDQHAHISVTLHGSIEDRQVLVALQVEDPVVDPETGETTLETTTILLGNAEGALSLARSIVDVSMSGRRLQREVDMHPEVPLVDIFEAAAERLGARFN